MRGHLTDKARLKAVVSDVLAERERALRKHGEPEDRPDGTGQPLDEALARQAQRITDLAAARGGASWRQIANEEVRESFAEVDPAALYTELIQSAQVFVSWAHAVRRRHPEVAK